MQGSLTEGEGSVQLTSFYLLVKTRLCTVDLLVLTCLELLFLIMNTLSDFFKQVTLMRRLSVQSFSLQLVFPGLCDQILKYPKQNYNGPGKVFTSILTKNLRPIKKG